MFLKRNSLLREAHRPWASEFFDTSEFDHEGLGGIWDAALSWDERFDMVVRSGLADSAWLTSVRDGAPGDVLGRAGEWSREAVERFSRAQLKLSRFADKCTYWLGSDQAGCVATMIGNATTGRAALFLQANATGTAAKLKLEWVASRLRGRVEEAWANRSRELVPAFDFDPSSDPSVLHAASLAEACPFAVLIVDMDSRIHLANSAAERLLASSDLFSMSNNRLIVLHTNDAIRLHVALHDVLSASPEKSRARSVALSCADSPPFLARVSRYGDGPPGAMACIMITHCATPPEFALEAFADAFNLTPVECRLIDKLLGGASLKEAATALKLKHETARGYLKQIFQKTGTHRQVDLISLLSNGALPKVSQAAPR